MPPLEPPHVGSVLADRYELVRHIARGGMGDVYEGADQLLQRRVAVKVFRAASPADRGRFDSEVRVLAGLTHPGLVRVYDAGPHGEDAFVVLELVDGPPQSDALADGATLPPDEVAELGRRLADALAFIHARGVVHRDVTPANVLCDGEGHPRLVDFGIIRLLDAPRVTSASIAIGTAAYMAPEQVQGQDVTPAADVYALGMVLLEALTGRREFTGTMQEAAVARLVRDPDTTTGVPPSWQPLLAAMTARDPDVRPAAGEVRERLAALRADDATVALAPVATVAAAATGSPIGPPRRRRPTRALAAAGIAAALAAAVIATAAKDTPDRASGDTTTTGISVVVDPDATDDDEGTTRGGGATPSSTEPTATTVAEDDAPATTAPPASLPVGPRPRPSSTTVPPTTAPPTTAPPTTAPPTTEAPPPE